MVRSWPTAATAAPALGRAKGAATDTEAHRHWHGTGLACSCMWFKAHLLHAFAIVCISPSAAQARRKSKSRKPRRFPRMPAYLVCLLPFACSCCSPKPVGIGCQSGMRHGRGRDRYAGWPISGGDCDFLATSATLPLSTDLHSRNMLKV